MKSSIRILAIALALAFLLLARTAFQQDTTASAAAIDLKNGEAAFADPLDGKMEATYLGFGASDTATVEFYIQSDALNTQVTAKTTNVTAGTAEGTRNILTLQSGTAAAGTIPSGEGSKRSAITDLLDIEYCTTDAATTSIDLAGDAPGADDVEVKLPSGWGLLPGSTLSSCARPTDEPAVTVATSTRNALADAEVARIETADKMRAQDANGGLYTYGSAGDTYTKVNPGLRYTRGTNETDVGGANRPLASVKATKKVTTGGGDSATTVSTNLLTFITNAAGGQFQSVSDGNPLGENGTTIIDTEFTYDIVDVYAAEDDTKPDADHKAYSSGFGRAYVSSGSDSGQWVQISEVTAVGTTTLSATTKLFRGSVEITNDSDKNDNKTIYTQDGDTLTLQVFSANGNRSSSVLASATATIDNSPPTVSDLSPADETITNDDTLRISFNVNDQGAGNDFRNIDKVVKMVQVQTRSGDGDKGTGEKCPIASGSDQILNNGGNASQVAALISPAGATFSGKCGEVVKTQDGGKFNLIITVEDKAGNQTTHTSQLTIDKQKPVVVDNPQVGKAWNADKNASSNSRSSILIEFSEALDANTVAASDFTVAGYTVSGAAVVGTNVSGGDQNLNKYVVLTLSEDAAKNARPSVTVSGVSDVAGNGIETATRTSDNKIAVALTVTPFAALVGEKGEQAISFTSDEALRSRSGSNDTKASVNGTKLAVKIASDTMGGSATFKETKFGDSRAYGVVIQAVDVDGNVTKAGAVSVSDEDFKLTDNVAENAASFKVKLANWPPADVNLDGNFSGEISAYVGSTKIAEAGSGDVVDWKAGTVTLATNDKSSKMDKGDTVTLKYSYVTADQVIQVDVTDPTLTSIPANAGSTDYAATAVQFNWSEGGEYAGDSYSTVTLNSASHKGPDGESMDILDALTTNDNKRWVYRPSADLAVGRHDFTLKATDAAGNDNTVTVHFTVTERKPVSVGLSPGWNLISLRGTPASLDVNDIFSSDSVSVVSQYDGRRVSPWTVWTRGSGGSLSSSPAGRTNIDPGLGIYVLSTDGSALSVDIPGASRDNPAELPPSISLIPGWNLIAVIILDRDTNSVAVDDYLPAGVWNRAFKRDNNTGALVSISPKASDQTTGAMVNAGQALWVYAGKAGVVTPSK